MAMIMSKDGFRLLADARSTILSEVLEQEKMLLKKLAAYEGPKAKAIADAWLKESRQAYILYVKLGDAHEDFKKHFKKFDDILRLTMQNERKGLL